MGLCTPQVQWDTLHIHILRKQQQVVSADGDPQGPRVQCHPHSPCLTLSLRSGPITTRLPPCPEPPAAHPDAGKRLSLLDSKCPDRLCMSRRQGGAFQSMEVKNYSPTAQGHCLSFPFSCDHDGTVGCPEAVTQNSTADSLQKQALESTVFY